jgi:hypothetical protein
MRLRTGLLAILLALCAAGASAAQNLSHLAPADEYFGHMKMSILGIANTIRDAGVKIDRGGDPESVIDGPLSFAEDAIRDWQHKYPRDPWIPRDLAMLRGVYERMQTERGSENAHRVAVWLDRDFRR